MGKGGQKPHLNYEDYVRSPYLLQNYLIILLPQTGPYHSLKKDSSPFRVLIVMFEQSICLI